MQPVVLLRAHSFLRSPCGYACRWYSGTQKGFGVPALRYPIISFVCFFIRIITHNCACSILQLTFTRHHHRWQLPDKTRQLPDKTRLCYRLAHKARLPNQRGQPHPPPRAKAYPATLHLRPDTPREGGRQGGRDGGREVASAAPAPPGPASTAPLYLSKNINFSGCGFLL
jgi:hypothetical protein